MDSLKVGEAGSAFLVFSAPSASPQPSDSSIYRNSWGLSRRLTLIVLLTVNLMCPAVLHSVSHLIPAMTLRNDPRFTDGESWVKDRLVKSCRKEVQDSNFVCLAPEPVVLPL